jgi:uncharacterized protein YeeX (DUF496 family)
MVTAGSSNNGSKVATTSTPDVDDEEYFEPSKRESNVQKTETDIEKKKIRECQTTINLLSNFLAPFCVLFLFRK